MTMRGVPLAGWLLLQGLLMNPACAGDAPAAVVVSTSKDPDWKTYRAFNAGLDVFDQQHGMAPTASLRFVLLPKAAGASLKDIKLRVAGDDISIPLAVAEDGTFAVPRSEAALKEDAELMLNRKPGTFRWRPDVHTPGVPPNARRLGDLRLECAVRWAVEQYELPYLFRKMLNAAGQPCVTARIKVDNIAPRPIAAMYLSLNGRRTQLPSSLLEDGGKVYLAPVHDQEWPDDALLEFEFIQPPGQATSYTN
ncbi:hypothetical protein [Duganella sp. HH101]|uniref:hypothetical protein n=1 Tax=Duganella sp. HH101 TaxID=1781066 RepID=UPI000892B755|nr:hypothetical protein [Duganella sp. HH101]OFA05617.1 hypothetical protein DUGA2_11950 [Duganella sp. HH101]